jgi:hypothetical protein
VWQTRISSCSGCVKRLLVLIKLSFLDQYLGITTVFERPIFLWQESAGEVVHRYCTQYIAQNVYKDCHMKRVNTLFKQGARHKKAWRNEKYIKKLTISGQHPISS